MFTSCNILLLITHLKSKSSSGITVTCTSESKLYETCNPWRTRPTSCLNQGKTPYGIWKMNDKTDGSATTLTPFNLVDHYPTSLYKRKRILRNLDSFWGSETKRDKEREEEEKLLRKALKEQNKTPEEEQKIRTVKKGTWTVHSDSKGISKECLAGKRH